jgi:hypothetical protein
MTVCYYGDASGCTKFDLAPIDYAEALRRPDGAKWSTSPQFGTIVDRTPEAEVLRSRGRDYLLPEASIPESPPALQSKARKA